MYFTKHPHVTCSKKGPLICIEEEVSDTWRNKFSTESYKSGLEGMITLIG